MDLNEQSLTSDSILFYLSGQQREATADKAPAAGAGRASTNGRPLSRSRASGNATAAPRVGSRLGREMLRDSSEDGGGAGGDRGYGSDGGGSGAGAAPPGETRPLSTLSLQVPGDSVQLEEEDDMMSPLTRLLAETPVRLAPAGDFRRQQEAYPRTGMHAFRLGWGGGLVCRWYTPSLLSLHGLCSTSLLHVLYRLCHDCCCCRTPFCFREL